MKLLGFLDPSAIVTDLGSCTKEDVVKALVGAVIEAGGASEDKREVLISQVLEREAKGTTGLGGGIALPHIKGTEHVAELCGAFGRSVEGVEYSAIDARPVHVFFLILSPADQLDRHIEILRKVSAIRENEYYLSSFMSADSPEALAQLIEGLGAAE